MLFNRRGLENAGFVGWLPFAEVRSSDCPPTAGVHVVTYSVGNPGNFAERSCGGWFKGKNPSVPLEVLVANWIDDAEVVYIGKADQLKRRLTELADFGAGKAVGHWGGRLIWQLPNIAALRIAWKETPGRDPLEVEMELIELFRQTVRQTAIRQRSSSAWTLTTGASLVKAQRAAEWCGAHRPVAVVGHHDTADVLVRHEQLMATPSPAQGHGFHECSPRLTIAMRLKSTWARRCLQQGGRVLDETGDPLRQPVLGRIL
jgi:hypothetical protein